MKGGGLTVAAFTQFTSREGEPQLHRHNVIANMAQRADGVDGKWRALNGRLLWHHQMWADSIGHEVLKEELESALPLRMELNADGTAYEIAGISERTKQALSSRRAQITGKTAALREVYESRHGHAPDERALWAMNQHSNWLTRQGKLECGGRGNPAAQLGGPVPGGGSRAAGHCEGRCRGSRGPGCKTPGGTPRGTGAGDAGGSGGGAGAARHLDRAAAAPRAVGALTQPALAGQTPADGTHVPGHPHPPGSWG